MPESSKRRDIEQAMVGVDWSAVLGEPAASTSIASALPDKIRDFRAADEAKAGEAPADSGTLSFASRRYERGQKIMNLKITDTAQAPATRQAIEEQLLSIGNEPTGQQQGDVLKGSPGFRAFHASDRVSRAAALLGGRFLVEVLVDRTDDANDAWDAIATLDVAKVLSSSTRAAKSPTAKQDERKQRK